MTRLVIPVENQAGLEAKVAQHFGRAPYYAIIELNKKGQISKVETQANTGEHMGGTGHPHENLLALKPDVIIAYGMGPGGLISFKGSGATVLKATGSTVKESIESLKEGKLTELTSGCEHAQEHHLK